MTIMVSYSRLDKKKVDAIVSDLKATGLKTWQDITDMKPGDEWRQILLRQPMTVNAFIPFLSENYVNSELCRMELFLARSTNREIFPILLRECWEALDTKEETKYISILFAARMEALRIVSLPVTREEMIARLAKDN